MVTDEEETTKPAIVEIEQALSQLLRGVVNIRIHERIAAVTGVTLDRACFWVLGRIAKHSQERPLRLSELAQTMSLDPSTVSRQVRQLETQGLVQREADPSDARAVMLATTAAGREILDRLLVARHQMLEKALAGWPDGDRQDIARLLVRLADDLTAAWQEVCT
jgi:DNA-binding MarR family transcriptional regulator